MTIVLYDEYQVRHTLKRVIDAHGGFDNYAQHIGLDQTLIRSMLRGDSTIGEKVLRDIGFMRVARYVKRAIPELTTNHAYRVDTHTPNG